MKHTSEILLMSNLVTEVGAQPKRAILPQWSFNPRFFLLVSGIEGEGSPSLAIKIEHSQDGVNWFDLYDSFSITGEGAYRAYTEDLITAFPFAFMRGNVTTLTNIDEVTVKLVAQMDRTY
jgi:hypothetical protein